MFKKKRRYLYTTKCENCITLSYYLLLIIVLIIQVNSNLKDVSLVDIVLLIFSITVLRIWISILYSITVYAQIHTHIHTHTYMYTYIGEAVR